MNLAYRWFCRLGLEGAVPERSTFSKNRHGRFADGDVMRRVFDLVVGVCAGNGLIGGTGALVDGSTVHADANRARTIAQRAGFSKLLDRMEKGDVLIVTKLDRLGRDAIDVSTTVAKLEDIGIRVHCLALGGVDLTSSAGKMTMNVINAVAQFERNLLIERTQSGLARAKAEGKPLGRPSVLSADQQKDVKEKIKNGEAISAIARQFETSRQTIMRVRDHA